MRVIIDGRFTETVRYYGTFPTEPTINPDSDITITLPIPADDQLSPMTLLAVMDRLLTVTEDQVMIYSHGNEDGLVMPLVTGSQEHPEREALHLMTILADATVRAAAIALMEASRQSGAWFELLNGLRALNRNPLFDGLARDRPASEYASQFQRLLDETAHGWDHVSRANLDLLLTRRNAVKAKHFARIEIRGCNIGRNSTTMSLLRVFFGSREVVAPNTVVFDGSMAIVVDRSFEGSFDRNVATRTQRAIAARRDNQPVPMYRESHHELPPVRVYDVNATAAGNEVFIRLWATSLHPHMFAGWMVATDSGFVRNWIEQNIATNSSRYQNGSQLPIHALWLRDDQDAPLDRPSIDISGDPLATPAEPPSFAFPRDPQFRQHLVLSS